MNYSARSGGFDKLKRESCGACGHTDLTKILDLGLSPIADAYTKTADELGALYPLQLVACAGCRLVQLLEIIPQEILFSTGYSFYTSASPPLSAYHEKYARDVWTRHSPSLIGGGILVEVGCNDGDFSRHFVGRCERVIGADPAPGPALVAQNRGVDVRLAPFTTELARELHAEVGPANVVVANHVLAHVEDVASTLGGIAEILAPRGTAYIEVQYLPDLLLNNAFDLVYHEHRNFYTLTSLATAARRWGLYVNEAQFTDRQGGSLRVSLSHHRGVSQRAEAIRASEAWLNKPGAFDGLQERAERVRTRLLDLIAVSNTSYLAGYGAPAKATTLLNFCGIGSETLRFVLDTTPAKQGRFIPGAGVKIISPEEALEAHRVDTYLLLAWNYVSQILRSEFEFTSAGGRWIVPIPVPTLF